MNSEAAPLEAETYRRNMLELAGREDPSPVMARMPQELRAVVEGARDHLRTRPADGEWSVLELLGHMADVEMVVGCRLRFILAQDAPELMGFDQDAWVASQHYNDADPEPLLQAISALRPLTVALYRGVLPAERARVGIHRERGPESLETVYRMLAGHDAFHLNQMRVTLAACAS